MKSAYDGMSCLDIQKISPRQREALWNQDRQTVADAWFNGDTSKAEAALEALPFSAIPSWEDVDRIARVFKCEHHRPVQHRDGKPPWCKVCGQP